MTLLTTGDIRAAAQRIHSSWQIVEDQRLEREFTFRDFASALAFTNRVGALAEEQNHHPDVHLSWGRVRLAIWSHDAGGLTRRDFRLAEAIDELPPSKL